MKRFKHLVIFLLLFGLISCNASFGEKYVIGNLEIYFTEEIEFAYVENVGNYFDKNDLILDKTHSVQLTSDTESFILKMVLNDSFKTLPESQEKNLELLERELKENVFQGLNFRIQVCNGNFVPINSLD